MTVRYLAGGVLAVLLGLIVHFHGGWMSAAARDVIGDALWALMMACWISAIAPKSRPGVRYVGALAVCFAVETSQLWHTSALDYARSTSVGRLVLGSGFDVRDFAAYTLGVLVFVLVDSRRQLFVADAPQV